MLSSLLPGNKDRLYLTLNHRWDQPGYHWSLVLAPKDAPGQNDPEVEDTGAKRWHVVNERRNPVTNRVEIIPWELVESGVNMYGSTSLITRFMLGKFKTITRGSTYKKVRAALDNVPVIRNDSNFTCRTWTLQAIEALVNAKLIQLSVNNMPELEQLVVATGDRVRADINARQLEIYKRDS